jgi:hypothetical protein
MLSFEASLALPEALRMENGEWRMENGEFFVVSC